MANLKLRRLASSNKVKFIETPSGVFNLQVDSSSTKFKSYDSSVSATLNGIFPASTFIEENSLGNPAVNSNHELNYIDTRGPEAPVTHVAQYNDFSVELTSPTLNYKTFKNDRTIEYEKDNVAVAIYPAPSADVFGNPIYDENYLNSLSGEPFRFEQLEYAYAGELPLNIVNYNYDDGKRYSDVFALKNHYDHHWNTSGSITVDSNSEFLSAELRHTRDYKRLGINKSDAWLSYRPQYQYNEDETRLPGSYLYVASGTYTPNTSARIGEVLNTNDAFVFSSSPGITSEVSATTGFVNSTVLSASYFKEEYNSWNDSNKIDLKSNMLIIGDPDSNTVNVYRQKVYDWVLTQQLTTEYESVTGFGYTVSLDTSNNRLAIGSNLDTNSFGNASLGGIYIFEFNDDKWVETHRIEPVYGGLSTNATFSMGLKLYDNHCVVGDPTVNGSLAPGIAIDFLYNGSTWIQNQILSAEVPHSLDFYGSFVEIYEDDLFISSDNADFYTSSGKVYYYQKDGNEKWNYTQVLTGSYSTEAQQRFGRGVSVWEDTCVIGAYDTNVGLASGLAYVFEKTGSTWIETQILSSNIYMQEYAKNVNIYENTIVTSHNNMHGNGIIEVFEKTDGEFIFTQILSGSDYTYDDTSINKIYEDNIISVGTLSGSTDIGIFTYLRNYDITSIGTLGNCYSFQVSGDNESGAITEYQNLSSIYVTSGDLYGYALASTENWLFISALNYKTISNKPVGAVIVKKRNETNNLFEDHQILYADYYQNKGDEFGKSLAVQGNYLFVGATEDEALDENNPTGVVHIFYLQNGVWNWLQKIVGENIDDDFGFQLETGKTNEIFIGAINGDVGNVPIKFKELGTGFSHGGGLTTSNEIYTWGNDDNGCLGINRQLNASIPQEIYGEHSFVKIKTIETHSIGLREDGTVWSWGTNDQGQLGNGEYTDVEYTPVSVLNNHSFIDIAITAKTSFGLKSNGELWAWGYNAFGQLGDGTTVRKNTPISVSGNINFKSVVGGILDSYDIYGIDENNNIWTWGKDNTYIKGANKSIPYMLDSIYSFNKLSVGHTHVLALSADGSAWCWGGNQDSKLGIGISELVSSSVLIPTPVSGNHIWYDINAGYDHSAGIDDNNIAYCWGGNAKGQLGKSDKTATSSPQKVSTTQYFTSIIAANYNTFAITDGNKLWSWGYNDEYQLGLGDNIDKSIPTQVLNIAKVSQIEANDHVTFVKANNINFVWGELNYTSLMNNGIIFDSPIKVFGEQNYKQVDTGFATHTVSLKENGEAWAWGYNFYGQLGDNSVIDKYTPVQVSNNHSFKKISAGYFFTAALKEDGSVWTWGNNHKGQLGNNTGGVGSTFRQSTPVSVVGGHSFVDIAAGARFVIALSGNGDIWGWGENTFGQLGKGDTTNYSSPIKTIGGHSFNSIYTGLECTFGLKNNGTLWSWGRNDYGQLGDETTNNKSEPGAVSGGIIFNVIAPGYYHCLGISSDYNLYSWGDNSSYQLGDGTIVDKSIPTLVSTNVEFSNVGAGSTASFGIKNKSNTAFSWGFNSLGQIAQPSNLIYVSQPVILSAIILGHNNGTVYRYEKGGGLDWEWKQTISGQYSQDGKFGTSIKYDSQSDGLYILDKYQYNENLKTFQNYEILSAEVSGILYAFERDNNDNFVEYDAIGFNSLSGTYTPIEILPNNTDLLISTEFVSGTTDYNTILLIFNKENGEWVPRSDVYNIQPEIIDIDEQFGKSLIKQNDYILIGHPGDDSDKGLIWVYERNNKIYMEKEEETTEISKYEFIERIQGVNRISSDASHKSNIFSIELKDSGLNESIDDVETRQKIQSSIKNAIKELLPKVTPAQTQLWKINFKGD